MTICQIRSRKRAGARSAMPVGGSSTWPSASTMRCPFPAMESPLPESAPRRARRAPRSVGREELGERDLQEAALALHGFGAPWILLRDGLEQAGAGEVPEDEQVERGGEVGQVGLLPRAAALGEQADALLVERLQQPGEGAREIATILQDGALDQAREVRVLREIDHEAIDERLAVSFQPGR